jgi:D-glycero-alpha-D-manno-heptose-7-phosphate kinase
MIIRSRAPVRITFGGGGTDIQPYDKEHQGLCLGATIDNYAYSSLTPRENPDIEITSWDLNAQQHFGGLEELTYDGNCDLIKAVIKKMNPHYGFSLYVRSDIKPHSGLGASASAAVSIIGAFNHLRKNDRLSKHRIAELAYTIEQEEIKNVTGRQDQYAATFGGINLYEFHGEDKVFVNPLDIKKDHILELEKNLIIARVGEKTETSGQVHKKEQGKSAIDIERLHEIKSIAIEMESALRRGKLNDFGLLIKESWDKKVVYNPNVTTPHIDSLIDLSLKNGAIGARLMGAGTGGNLLIYCKPNKEQVVAKKLEEEGAKIIPFSFDFTGLQTWEAEE